MPDKVGKGRIKNTNCNVKGPDGHTLEIVQYEPDGWTICDKSKALNGPRLSNRMMHLGILVGALEPAMKFYRDIFGFEEIRRGGRSEKRLGWVNIKVPARTTSSSCSMMQCPVPTLAAPSITSASKSRISKRRSKASRPGPPAKAILARSRSGPAITVVSN